MVVKTKAIVLSVLKYQEKSYIVKCFTLSNGLKTYFVPSLSNKKNGITIAHLQCLNILEIVANHKNKSNLEYFKEIKISYLFHTISFDIIKTSIAIFLSEVLNHAIKEEEKNESLFYFLETTLIWLDTHEETVNFHLIFLLELSKFLGFYPEQSQTDFLYFNIVEGEFNKYQDLNCLTSHESLLLKKLLETKFDRPQKLFNATERQILLKILMEYYSSHLVGFKKPKSLEVLKEVFS